MIRIKHLLLLITGYGGDMTVSYAPSSLRFVHANTLRSSFLDDMLAVAMGYTSRQVGFDIFTADCL